MVWFARTYGVEDAFQKLLNDGPLADVAPRAEVECADTGNKGRAAVGR